MPRYRSPRSGPLFDRIAAAENLTPIRDKTLSHRQRFDLFRDFGALPDVAGLYVKASSKERGSFDAELVELYVTSLRLHLAGADWAEDMVATIPRDDPNRERRLGGLNGMRAAGARWIREGLQAFRSGAFRKSELLRFAENLRPVVPQYLAFLAADVRKPVLEDLARLESTEPDPEVKAALKSLLDAAIAVPATQPAR